MNATGATLVFSATHAAMGLAAAYDESIGHALLALALVSAVVAFAVTLATLPVLDPIPWLWLLLLAINVAMAALGFFLGRTPLFPKAPDETRS